MRLYELSDSFEQLFAEFERINAIEAELTEVDGGMYEDATGNIIPDVVEYKNELLQAWYDTLDGIEGEIETKAASVACYIKDLKAQAAAIADEKKQLDARKKSAERKAQSLTAYLLRTMQQINRKRIDTPQASLSLSDGRESVKINDEAALIAWAQENGHDELLTYKSPEASKKAIKAALDGGAEIPFACLERTPSITIK